MQQVPNREMAEMSVINLFQYAESAPLFAYKWMASDDELQQYVGFLLMGRLFMQKREPNERGVHEFIDQALVALQGASLPLRKAALTAVNRFAELGENHYNCSDITKQHSLSAFLLFLDFFYKINLLYFSFSLYLCTDL